MLLKLTSKHECSGADTKITLYNKIINKKVVESTFKDQQRVRNTFVSLKLINLGSLVRGKKGLALRRWTELLQLSPPDNDLLYVVCSKKNVGTDH